MSEDKEIASLKGHLRDLGSYLIALSDSDEGEKGRESLDGREAPVRAQRIDDLPRLRAMAMEEYRSRRSRPTFFPTSIFGEPAWDMLLDLFVARIDGKRISVTSACAASDCPPTTALRWVTILEEEGLIRRTEDTADKRRMWVFLTDAGMQNMEKYLRSKNSASFTRKLLSDLARL